MKKIVLKYDGKCIKCGQTIPAGQEAYWEKDKGIWHFFTSDCGAGVPEKEFRSEGRFHFERAKSGIPSKVARRHTASKGLWVSVAVIVLLAFILGGLAIGPMVVRPPPPITVTVTATTTTTRTGTVTTTITTCTTNTTCTQKWIPRKPTDPDVINWADAGKYVGQTKTVEGTIVRAYRSSAAIFLDFHDPYQGYFMVVIFKSDWANFKFQPEIFYKNKEVRVTGPIKTYQGSPEIVASSPTQIEVACMGFNYP